ncbi:hypothetical protein, partial [Listeria monocytogenes]|uniref:hypothetical protein n=1 Tax=Listeria monocytogenes TaxID=1639 RepID=UPI002FDC1F19
MSQKQLEGEIARAEFKRVVVCEECESNLEIEWSDVKFHWAVEYFYCECPCEKFHTNRDIVIVKVNNIPLQ